MGFKIKWQNCSGDAGLKLRGGVPTGGNGKVACEENTRGH